MRSVNLAVFYETPPVSPEAQLKSKDKGQLDRRRSLRPVMDHYDPSRRQYAPTSYPGQQQQQQNTTQTAGPYTTPGSVERVRQSAYLQQSPTSVQPTGRTSSDAQTLYNFSQGVQYATGTGMQGNQMQYGQEYQPQEPRQQTQQYQQYGGNVMYGMQPQAHTHAQVQAQAQAQVQAAQSHQQQQSQYEQVPQFRQPRSAAPETLATQFEQPQPTAQYYLAGQSIPTTAPPTELAGSQLPSQYQQTAYAQPGLPASQTYAGAMLDPAQTAAYQAYGQQQQYASQQQQQQQQAESVDQAFSRYQNHVRNVFSHARDGDLRDVPDMLVQISHYLLGSAEALGLTRDDEALHDDRVRLWDEFNRAWLAVLQRQHDLTHEMLQTGQPLHEPQLILSTPALEQLAKELVHLCDSIEKHGLVDYQMGVAEEEIMDLLLRCLSLLEEPNDRPDETAAHAETSSAATARLQR